jgi:hypothetical protein
MPNDLTAGDRRPGSHANLGPCLVALLAQAGELTFTQKLKRRAMEASWKSLLEEMYAPGAEGLV